VTNPPSSIPDPDCLQEVVWLRWIPVRGWGVSRLIYAIIDALIIVIHILPSGSNFVRI